MPRPHLVPARSATSRRQGTPPGSARLPLLSPGEGGRLCHGADGSLGLPVALSPGARVLEDGVGAQASRAGFLQVLSQP